MEDLKLLNSPIRIGRMIVKNRINFPPMNTNYANENGVPTRQMIEYYGRRAKGGAGLVTVEAVTVDARSRNHGAQPRLVDDTGLNGWSRLTDKVKRYGARVTVELVHMGSDGDSDFRVSSSNITSKGNFPVHPLSVEEILKIEDQFAETARLAKQVGFDAITLHAAHGVLLSEFLSPLYNKRNDAYGGSVENRARIVVEVIEKIRKQVGPAFPIIVRFSAVDLIEGGQTIEDSKKLAKLLEQAGADALDISAGNAAAYLFSIAPYSLPGMMGNLVPYAKQIKSVVKIPVITAGGIRNPYVAEGFLQDGCADIVSFGRPFIADPDFGKKCLCGKFEDVRPCLSCQNCMDSMDKGSFLACTVNAEAGREDEFGVIQKAEEKKKVCVVGGGPAGMEAARVAALRGHEVVLVEKRNQLGGSVLAAGIPPHKEKLLELIDWYKKQLSALGVTVQTGTAFDAKKLEDDFDAVILACGASYLRRIPGSDRPGVITAIEALLEPDRVGEKIAVIGGGVSACEVAEYFGGRAYEFQIHGMKDFGGELVYDRKEVANIKNKDVTIIEMLDDIASDMDSENRIMMKFVLEQNGVKVLTGTRVEEIREDGVSVVSLRSGETQLVEADTIILAGGLCPNEIGQELPSGIEVFSAGDCTQPGKIVKAVYQGYSAALEL